MKKIIKFLFVGLFFIIISCNKKVELSDDFIKNLSNVNSNIPSPYVQYNLYLKTMDNNIFETNVKFLSDIYIKYYNNDYKDFYDFLKIALKQKLKIKNSVANHYEYGIFSESSKIVELSNKEIIKKYFIIGEDVFYFYPKNISIEEKKTILYKMFLDGYLITFDDYAGKYIIKKYNLNK
ncbi:hypothetical protein DRF65_17900 [Chryseobacterium pennae]|uniref:Lipoprotein n=1 Tax=Chryseobacterium pennae TaxID=2258962 RepID=A0A3D9C603_9FLAO|nr:hypothetical protein [Chryseobacterium pennae]REC60911.1 hypothetical protein DRF65_17900 [Chryseobacterium pennae]